MEAAAVDPVSPSAPIRPLPWLAAFLRSLNRDRRAAFGLTILLWALCALLYMMPFLALAGRPEPLGMLGYAIMGGCGMALSLLLLGAIAFAVTRPRPVALGVAIASVVLLSAVLSLLDIAIFDRIGAVSGLPYWRAASYVARFTDNFAIFSTQFSFIAVTYWTMERSETHRQRERELEATRTAMAQAQNAASLARLSALRYQLNPHFLFNTLNSISSLVMTDRKQQAEEMLAELADFLRETLVADPAEQTLERELETVTRYLNIELVRFGQRLAVDIQCPAELRDAPMPSFMLQPLVENAIKFGVSESERPVTIRIEAMRDGEDLVVLVEDDGASKGSTGGTGVGLRNVRERLHALYGERGRLEVVKRDVGFLALVRLPLGLT